MSETRVQICGRLALTWEGRRIEGGAIEDPVARALRVFDAAVAGLGPR